VKSSVDMIIILPHIRRRKTSQCSYWKEGTHAGRFRPSPTNQSLHTNGTFATKSVTHTLIYTSTVTMECNPWSNRLMEAYYYSSL